MKVDDQLDALRSRLAHIALDPGDPDEAMRRGSRIRTRRAWSAVVVGVLMTSAIAGPLVLLAGLRSANDERVAVSSPSQLVIEAGGLRLVAPSGWDGRALTTTDERAAILQVANFPLSDGPSSTAGLAEAMAPGDVIIILIDWTPVCPCSGFVEVSLPLPANEIDFDRPLIGPDVWNSSALPAGVSWVGRTWLAEGRYLAGLVIVADPRVDADQAAGIDAVVGALAVIGPLRIPGSAGVCPEGGPWSDSDCAQRQWVDRVLASGRFDVVGSTGTAVVAVLGSERFFIWTTSSLTDPLSAEVLSQEGYATWRQERGIEVFTDGTRYVWTVRGLNVWTASEGGDSVSAEVLLRLVRASDDTSDSAPSS